MRADELRSERQREREGKESKSSAYGGRDLWEHPVIIKPKVTWGQRVPECLCCRNTFYWAESKRRTSWLIFGTDLKQKSSEINSKSLTKDKLNVTSNL